jgi:hypothetical protein
MVANTREARDLDLRGRTVFLAASIPFGERGERYAPYDARLITDAVVAVTRGLLAANGRLVYGGHPTITPLVLHVASDFGVDSPDRILVYQSRHFEKEITEATRELERQRFGTIIQVDADGGSEREPSLLEMRTKMFRETQPIAAFFVGGMDGIEREWGLVAELTEGRVLRVAFGSPGGAARGLVAERDELLADLTPALGNSQHFPVLVRRVLERLVDRRG